MYKKCPYCKKDLVKAIIAVDIIAVGKIFATEEAKFDIDKTDLTVIQCGHCGRDLPLSTIESWDFNKDQELLSSSKAI